MLREAESDISAWVNDVTEEELAWDNAFIRITVTGPTGKQAFTRPYRRSEIV